MGNPTPATKEEINVEILSGYRDDIVIMKEDIPLLEKHHVYLGRSDWRSLLYATAVEPNIDVMYMRWPQRIWESNINFPRDNSQENFLFNVMKKWKEDPPDDLVLKEFKDLLRTPDIFEDGYGAKTRGKCTIVENVITCTLTYGPDYAPFEFIELLIHFGGHSNKWLDDLKTEMGRLAKEASQYHEKISNYVEKTNL
jgi:hypothetical protein